MDQLVCPGSPSKRPQDDLAQPTAKKSKTNDATDYQWDVQWKIKNGPVAPVTFESQLTSKKPASGVACFVVGQAPTSKAP